MSRVVITHPEMGIFVGEFLDMGFWSLLDAAGQVDAMTFESDQAALDFVEQWLPDAQYARISCVPVRSEYHHASVEDLFAAGLESAAMPLALNERRDTGRLQ